MNREETIALQTLTGREYLEDVSVEELTQAVSESPYFPAAQLLLCKKMQQSRHSLLQQQLYKTALYFPNEQWLHYLLLDSDSVASRAPASSADVEEPVTANKNENAPAERLANSSVVSPVTDFAEPQPAEQEDTHAEEANLITLPAEDILLQMPSAESIQEEPEELPLDDDELEQQLTEPIPFAESSEKISSLLSEQVEAFHQPLSDENAALAPSDPYHTIDYFASQGINLEAKKEGNGFDAKVHKFTDWLRQMKRINPHPMDLGTDADEENLVATIADTSNHTKEVLTESMAEVLLKQGKNDKAAEVYQKLSLLYPDKNTYFARRIEEIK